MLTVRDRPLFVVPSIRVPPTTVARTADPNLGPGQVYITPAQVEQLAAAATGVGSQTEESKQAMTPRHVKAARCARRWPGVSARGSALEARPGRTPGRVTRRGWIITAYSSGHVMHAFAPSRRLHPSSQQPGAAFGAPHAIGYGRNPVAIKCAARPRGCFRKRCAAARRAGGSHGSGLQPKGG